MTGITQWGWKSTWPAQAAPSINPLKMYETAIFTWESLPLDMAPILKRTQKRVLHTWSYLEYQTAREHNKPRLIFLLHERAAWPADLKDKNRDAIDKFRNELRAEQIVEFFKDQQSLLGMVTRAVSYQYGIITARLRSQPTKPLPKLLPYMANRDEQIYKLMEIFESAQKHPQRPTVCVLYGHEQECHEKFFERLEDAKFREIVRNDRPPSFISLACPKLENASEFKKSLLINLSKQVLDGRFYGEMHEINRRLTLNKAPVVIHSTMDVESWRNRSNLVAYLDFWKTWPETPVNQVILVLLFWKYSSPGKTRLFQVSPDRTINRITKRYRNRADDQYRFLPKLRPVSRQEAENWMKRDDVRQFYRDESVQEELRAIYGDKAFLPMAQWAKHCKEVLERHL